MDVIRHLFDVLDRVYTWPMHVSYDSFDGGQRDWGLTILAGVLIYGCTLLVLVLFVAYAIRMFKVLKKRQHCQHNSCDHHWTLKTNDRPRSNCQTGQACCGMCQERHLDEDVQLQASNELRLSCPNCNGRMDKVIAHRIIKDVCSRCGGLFLDHDELNKLIEIAEADAYEDGWQDGSSRTSGVLAGGIIGGIVAGGC